MPLQAGESSDCWSSSRGELPLAFVSGTAAPQEFFASIHSQVWLRSAEDGQLGVRQAGCVKSGGHVRRAHCQLAIRDALTCPALLCILGCIPPWLVGILGHVKLAGCDKFGGCAHVMASLALQDYAGFNLVVADLSASPPCLSLLTNRSPCGGGSSGSGNLETAVRVAAQVLPPGVHSLSNAPSRIALPAAAGATAAGGWQRAKEEHGCAALQQLLDSGAFEQQGRAVPWARLFALLSDEHRCSTQGGSAPDTGYGEAFEVAASSIFSPVRVAHCMWGRGRAGQREVGCGGRARKARGTAGQGIIDAPVIAPWRCLF